MVLKKESMSWRHRAFGSEMGQDAWSRREGGTGRAVNNPGLEPQLELAFQVKS